MAHFSSSTPLLQTIAWLNDIWVREFDDALLVDTSAKTLTSSGAVDIEVLVERQKLYIDKMTKKLLSVWWQGLADRMIDDLSDAFEFFATEIEDYIGSPTETILRRFELQMVDQLRELMERSALAWVDVLRRHSTAGEG